MELLKVNNKLVTLQRQGNDKNGNPVYLINIFQEEKERYNNINELYKANLDKYSNIRIKSHNVKNDILSLIESV